MNTGEILENFTRMISGMEVSVPEEGILAGPVRPIRHAMASSRFINYGIGWDNAHFPLDYGLLMREGIPGIIRRASRPAENLSREAAEYRRLIADCWRLISGYIRRHADAAEELASGCPEDAARLERISRNCRSLTERPPESFEEGLQLFWFIWRLRAYYTSSIGRMDRHLYPLYARDVPDSTHLRMETGV